MAIQLIGSLVAILVLAAIAWALKLGPPAAIDGDKRARELAREADSGFKPEQVAVARDGGTAILADDQGRIMVLRRHGTHFAGRLLEAGATADVSGEILIVTTTDRRFGTVGISLGEHAGTWESRIHALNEAGHA